MNTIFSKTFDHHRLLLNLTDKINLKKVINMLLYHVLAYTIHKKYRKVIDIINRR